MDEALSVLNKFNWQTIIAMFAIGWYFTRDIKIAMEKQSDRTDKLYEMFIDLIKEGRK